MAYQRIIGELDKIANGAAANYEARRMAALREAGRYCVPAAASVETPAPTSYADCDANRAERLALYAEEGRMIARTVFAGDLERPIGEFAGLQAAPVEMPVEVAVAEARSAA